MYDKELFLENGLMSFVTPLKYLQMKKQECKQVFIDFKIQKPLFNLLKMFKIFLFSNANSSMKIMENLS